MLQWLLGRVGYSYAICSRCWPELLPGISTSTWMRWRGQTWFGGTASSKIGMAHHLWLA